MEADLYIDIVFIVNFIMDFLLLLSLSKILKKPAVLGRIGAGAAVGGVFGCLEVLLWRYPAWLWLAASIGAAMAMTSAAYRPGDWRERIKSTVSLYGLSIFAGGIMEFLRGFTGAGANLLKLLPGHAIPILPLAAWIFLTAGTCFLAWGMWQFAGEMVRERKDRYPVILQNNGVVVKTTGYLDTGNCLTEPLTGQGVQIVTERIWTLLGESGGEKTMIPYHTIGNPYGLMEGRRIEQLEIQGIRTGGREENIRISNPWIAKAPFGISYNGGYEVLLHGETAIVRQDKKGGITNGD